MQTIVVVIYCIIIFPFSIKIKTNFSSRKKTFNFTIDFFNYIKIVKGMILADKHKIKTIINNKIKYLNFNDLIKAKKNAKPLKDYHFYKLNITLDIGSANNLVSTFCLAFIINNFIANIKNYLYYKKPHLKISSVINVHENKSIFKFDINGVIVLNLLMILLSLIKMGGEKIFNAISKRK